MVPWTDDFYANEPDIIAVLHQDNKITSNFWTRFQWYGCIMMGGCGLYFGSFLSQADSSEFILALCVALAVLGVLLTACAKFYVCRLEQLKQVTNDLSSVIAVTCEGIRVESFEIVDGVISPNSADTPSTNCAKNLVLFAFWEAPSIDVLACSRMRFFGSVLFASISIAFR
jgi:hypothetical protein